MIDKEKEKAEEKVKSDLDHQPDPQNLLEEVSRLRAELAESKKSSGRSENERNPELLSTLENMKAENEQIKKLNFQQQNEIESLKTSLNEEHQRALEKEVNALLSKLFIEKGGLAAAMQDALAAIRTEKLSFSLDTSGELSARNADGEPVNLETYILNFLEQRPYFARSSQTIGSNYYSRAESLALNSSLPDGGLKSRESRFNYAKLIANK